MSGFSDYWENEVLDHLFGKGSYPAPQIYVALSTTAPAEDGSGVTEPQGGAYARLATTGADWTSASAGQVCNMAPLAFPEATGAWGTITHFALVDAGAGGHLLAFGPLNPAQPLEAGDILRFDQGRLSVTLD
jgi:hypothetical protein